jgi:predicted RNase H-like nuclease (RuvC/YqgF family)
MKTLTRDRVEKMRTKAINFVRDVVGDSDKADEIAGLSVDEYAQRKKITIVNPRRKSLMSTKQDLEAQIEELEEINSDLEDRLDQIEDLVAVEQESEGEGDEAEEEPVPNRRRR